MNKKKKPNRTRAPGPRRWTGRVIACGMALSLLGIALYVLELDRSIRTRFEGRRWALATRMYGRPLEIYDGLPLSPGEFAVELEEMGYRQHSAPGRPATYAMEGNVFRLKTRPFTFWDREEPSRRLKVSFSGDTVSEVRDLDADRRLGVVRLDPPLIGSIYPEHNEDRILVRLEELPPELPAALVAVEDRNFYRHRGLDIRAIGRALLANLRAGRVVQGGSTLTQQLVKNYFLTSERTLWRKANEAVMALLLEFHYGKEEILEAYLNEIYLGQQASRAIHGVGLASQFYFGRPADELELTQVALVVALARGPSLYDPRRHPEQALDRRNRILDLLAERGVVSEAEVGEAKASALGVTPDPPQGVSRFPAFLDLVHRQLRIEYREEDLRSEGLRVFTTLDPRMQDAAEGALTERIRLLERGGKVHGGLLQGAVVVTRPGTGEVLALVGGRRVRFAGFNRALDAIRPIGSLVKPAVYLAALERPEEFTLATPVDDSPLQVEGDDGSAWAPQNYDRQSHGTVTVYEALIYSYNLATTRLGLALGIPRVSDTLGRLGVRRELPSYPSILLGAVELSPVDVAQMYQTLAGGGFYTPLRAIREVVDAHGRPLERYPIRVEQVADPGAVHLLNTALQAVVREGTGRALLETMPPELSVAGKTGTTNDLRDSWFAGFTGDWLAVVWLGRDDNRPIGLSGAEGALRVWADLLLRCNARPLTLAPPDYVEYAWVDRTSGLLTRPRTEGAVNLPFIAGSAPREPASRSRRPSGGLWSRITNWLKGRSE